MKALHNLIALVAIFTLNLLPTLTRGQNATFETNDPEMARRYAEMAKQRGLQVEVSLKSNGTSTSITLENNRQRIERNGKYGYVDSTGITVIPFTYDYAHDFNDGYAVVGKKAPAGSSVSYHKWHIDTSGKPLYGTNLYCDVHNFVNGYAVVDVTGGHKMCHIKRDGTPLYAERYTSCWDFNQHGRALVEKANPKADKVRYLVINRAGQVVGYKEYSFKESRSDLHFMEKVHTDLARHLQP